MLVDCSPIQNQAKTRLAVQHATTQTGKARTTQILIGLRNLPSQAYFEPP